MIYGLLAHYHTHYLLPYLFYSPTDRNIVFILLETRMHWQREYGEFECKWLVVILITWCAHMMCTWYAQLKSHMLYCTYLSYIMIALTKSQVEMVYLSLNYLLWENFLQIQHYFNVSYPCYHIIITQHQIIIFESNFRSRCARKLNGALRKSTPSV